jgi:hypothetical protein
VTGVGAGRAAVGSGEVEKWSNGLFQLERRGDKVGLDGTRGLRSGGSMAVRWRAAAQLLCAHVASVQAAD